MGRPLIQHGYGGRVQPEGVDIRAVWEGAGSIEELLLKNYSFNLQEIISASASVVDEGRGLK